MSENKNSSKGLIFTIILLIFVIIGMSIYILYDKGIIFKQEEAKSVETKEETDTNKTKDLNINSGLVQGLFNLVNVDSLAMNWKMENGTTVEKMSYLEKFTLAINAIKNKKLQ